METLRRIEAVRQCVAGWRSAGLGIGLVPTMGSLHDGHLSLVELARRQADRVVASLFVNPLQFGAGEDFDRYPRDLARDSRLLTDAGVALLFAPEVSEIYPDGNGPGTVVDVPALSGVLEGRFRPGHFVGVATVVAKLLHIVQPDVAVFGEKDFQQLAVIRRLVRDLCLPVRIAAGPIVRESDGLALSSRNAYLKPHERAVAPLLYRQLRETAARIGAGDRDWGKLEAQAQSVLAQSGFAPDYFSVRRAEDLRQPYDSDQDLVILAAVRLGATRLIDNLRLRLSG